MIHFDSNRFFGKENRLYFMGIAIVWILGFHIFSNYQYVNGDSLPVWSTIFNDGYIGVDIFLLLSIYGLTISWEKCPESGNHSAKKKFFLNRFKRIYPFLFSYLLILSLTFLRHIDTISHIRLFVDNLCCLSLFLNSAETVDLHIDWYSQAILLIYIFFPLIYRCNKWLMAKGIKYCILALLLLIIIARLPIYPTGLQLFVRRFPLLFIGSMLYISQTNGKENSILQLSLLGTLICFFLMDKYLFISMCAVSLILLFCMVDIPLPFKRLFQFIGRYTYELYLSQLLWTYYFIFAKITDDLYLTIAVCVGGTIVGAILIHWMGVGILKVAHILTTKK